METAVNHLVGVPVDFVARHRTVFEQQLAGGLVSGITIGSWGGGQVMSLGGRMFGHGDFSHTNRSAVGVPAGAMDQLEAAGIVGVAQGSKPREVLITDENTLNALLAKLRGAG